MGRARGNAPVPSADVQASEDRADPNPAARLSDGTWGDPSGEPIVWLWVNMSAGACGIMQEGSLANYRGLEQTF